MRAVRQKDRSAYVRKVHFRDPGMIRQIEEKVVNRLRQVTSAIPQDGANQVSTITSTAEREAAAEFARAEAIRSQIVGQALEAISRDKEVASTLFEILEIQNLLEGKADITLVPAGTGTGILLPITAGERVQAPSPQVPGASPVARPVREPPKRASRSSPGRAGTSRTPLPD